MTTAVRLLAQLGAHKCTATTPGAGTHIHRCRYLTTATEPAHALHLCPCGDLYETEAHDARP